MLETTTNMFEWAKKEHFAIPATNFIDLDSARTFVATSEAENKPLILAFAEAHQEFISLEEAALVGKFLAEKAKTPVALHLDHGMTPDLIKKAIELGFTSVMIDASTCPLKENIQKTKAIVDYAHARGVAVEAEIGHVGAGTNYENHETTDSIYTEVSDAVQFVQETQVNSLAISIGTAHGLYKGTPNINFERLAEIRKAVDTPLVLHGGSGSGDNNLSQCASEGICKINIFTDFMVNAMSAITEGKPSDYATLKKLANEGMKKELEKYYGIFHTKSINK